MISQSRHIGVLMWSLVVVGLLASGRATAQEGKGGKSKSPDFIPAGYDDYQHMLDRLGIKKMRRGRDGRGPDTSTEATANPFKDSLPDLMTFKDGTKVTSADQWPKRRAEIVEDFEREIYGRIPKNVPKVTWEVTKTAEGESGGIATVTKTLVGHVDNSDFPKIKVAMQASFTVPKNAAGRVPIIVQFGGGFGFGFGGRGGGKSWTQQALDQGLGLRHDQPEQHSGGQQSPPRRHYRPDEQGRAAEPRGLGRAARLGLGRELPDRLLRGQSRFGGRSDQGLHHRRVALRQGGAGRHGVRSRASRPDSSPPPEPAARSCFAATSANCWKTSPAAASITGWPATS